MKKRVMINKTTLPIILVILGIIAILVFQFSFNSNLLLQPAQIAELPETLEPPKYHFVTTTHVGSANNIPAILYANDAGVQEEVYRSGNTFSTFKKPSIANNNKLQIAFFERDMLSTPQVNNIYYSYKSSNNWNIERVYSAPSNNILTSPLFSSPIILSQNLPKVYFTMVDNAQFSLMECVRTTSWSCSVIWAATSFDYINDGDLKIDADFDELSGTTYFAFSLVDPLYNFLIITLSLDQTGNILQQQSTTFPRQIINFFLDVATVFDGNVQHIVSSHTNEINYFTPNQAPQPIAQGSESVDIGISEWGTIWIFYTSGGDLFAINPSAGPCSTNPSCKIIENWRATGRRVFDLEITNNPPKLSLIYDYYSLPLRNNQYKKGEFIWPNTNGHGCSGAIDFVACSYMGISTPRSREKFSATL